MLLELGCLTYSKGLYDKNTDDTPVLKQWLINMYFDNRMKNAYSKEFIDILK